VGEAKEFQIIDSTGGKPPVENLKWLSGMRIASNPKQHPKTKQSTTKPQKLK
jgi:hypothetical protein